jgi:hypothetical protein
VHLLVYVSVIIVTIHEINCGKFASYSDNYKPSNSDFIETFIELLCLLKKLLKTEPFDIYNLNPNLFVITLLAVYAFFFFFNSEFLYA